MAIENASYISQLDPTRPYASDSLSEADGHFRLVKRVLQQTLPGSDDDAFDVPLTVGPRRLNELAAQLDLGNLVTLSGTQTITGAKTFTQPVSSNTMRRSDLDKGNIIGVGSGVSQLYIGSSGTRHDVTIRTTTPQSNGAGGLVVEYPVSGGTRRVSVLTEASAQTILDFVYPVGAVVISAGSANPGTVWAAFGADSTWVADCEARMLVGVGTTTDARGNVVTVGGGERGGSIDKVLTVANLPPHIHDISAGSQTLIEDAAGGTDSRPWQDPGNPGIIEEPKKTKSTGSGTPFDVVPPYKAFYIWRRTA